MNFQGKKTTRKIYQKHKSLKMADDNVGQSKKRKIVSFKQETPPVTIDLTDGDCGYKHMSCDWKIVPGPHWFTAGSTQEEFDKQLALLAEANPLKGKFLKSETGKWRECENSPIPGQQTRFLSFIYKNEVTDIPCSVSFKQEFRNKNIKSGSRSQVPVFWACLVPSDAYVERVSGAMNIYFPLSEEKYIDIEKL